MTENAQTFRPMRGPLEWAGEDLGAGGRRSSLEWLEADGLGGFACGTAGGSNLRRYHGWYAPPSPSSPRRAPIVTGCDEFVWCDGETVMISRRMPADAEDAEDECRLVRFALEPFPTWWYRTERFFVERSLCLVRGRSIAVARYVNRGACSVGLRARPLLRSGARPSEAKGPWRDPNVEIRGEGAWIRSLPGPERLFLRGAGTLAPNVSEVSLTRPTSSSTTTERNRRSPASRSRICACRRRRWSIPSLKRRRPRLADTGFSFSISPKRARRP